MRSILASKLSKRLLVTAASCVLAGAAVLYAEGGPSAGGSNGQPSAQVSVGGVQVGQLAPEFRLQDQDGKEVSLSQFNGKVVVLEWTNPNCPFVVRHYKAGTMKSLETKYKDKGVVWLAINSTNDATTGDNKKWVAAQELDYPVLDDSRGTTGHAYGAKTTPHMFIIDKDERIVYEGGIDNDKEGNKGDGKINYVDRALDEITAGKHVTIPEAAPYGCGVHYAKPAK